MNKYEKTFYSTDGQEFIADVYSVLEAFNVTNPAVQHAVKKLLMPGQRGAKSELQDLDEAHLSVCRAIDMVRARLPKGGTLTGETLAEVAEAKRDRAIAWADITRREIPAEMDGGQETPLLDALDRCLSKAEPDPEPKPKFVTWRLCVRIRPDEIYDGNFYAECEWYRSGDIPEHWYPVEAHTRPVETIKQLPEGETP